MSSRIFSPPFFSLSAVHVNVLAYLPSSLALFDSLPAFPKVLGLSSMTQWHTFILINGSNVNGRYSDSTGSSSSNGVKFGDKKFPLPLL